MKYQIIGKNIEVTEGISAAIQKKMSRMDKYFLIGDDVECRAVCSTHIGVQKVEITIFLPKIKLRAEVEDPDLYCAMDKAIDKLEGQMRKLKTRMDRSAAKAGLSHDIAFNIIEEEAKKEEEDVVVRTKSYYLEPMTIDDAITQMDALGHDFFVYLDEEDDRVSVVYVRKDGGYGVIQAENPLKQ